MLQGIIQNQEHPRDRANTEPINYMASSSRASEPYYPEQPTMSTRSVLPVLSASSSKMPAQFQQPFQPSRPSPQYQPERKRSKSSKQPAEYQPALKPESNLLSHAAVDNLLMASGLFGNGGDDGLKEKFRQILKNCKKDQAKIQKNSIKVESIKG